MAVDTAQKRSSVIGLGTPIGVPGWPGGGVDVADRAQSAGEYAGFTYPPPPPPVPDFTLTAASRGVLSLTAAGAGVWTLTAAHGVATLSAAGAGTRTLTAAGRGAITMEVNP